MEKASTAYEEARMITDLEILKRTRVIGMTTSAAARMRKLLQALAPPIGKHLSNSYGPDSTLLRVGLLNFVSLESIYLLSYT